MFVMEFVFNPSTLFSKLVCIRTDMHSWGSECGGMPLVETGRTVSVVDHRETFYKLQPG
jgi:hypothetical protein